MNQLARVISYCFVRLEVDQSRFIPLLLTSKYNFDAIKVSQATEYTLQLLLNIYSDNQEKYDFCRSTNLIEY